MTYKLKQRHRRPMPHAAPAIRFICGPTNFRRKKADEYLGHLVGHEGAGSLLSALKASAHCLFDSLQLSACLLMCCPRSRQATVASLHLRLLMCMRILARVRLSLLSTTCSLPTRHLQALHPAQLGYRSLLHACLATPSPAA